MTPCPKGAILNHDDLKIAAASAQLAAEFVEGIIDTETPHGRRATPKARERLKALRTSAREYRTHLRKIEGVRMARRHA
jgi:hypothetical protein